MLYGLLKGYGYGYGIAWLLRLIVCAFEGGWIRRSVLDGSDGGIVE